MSIDGIGRGAPPAPSIGPTGVSSAVEVEKPFNVAAVPQVGEAHASGALSQLERGKITFEQYLDLHTTHALQHLEGKLPQTQLAFIEAELRAQLESDPVLLELVRRATGTSRLG